MRQKKSKDSWEGDEVQGEGEKGEAHLHLFVTPHAKGGGHVLARALQYLLSNLGQPDRK